MDTRLDTSVLDPAAPEASDDGFLFALGRRVRLLRQRRNVTRKVLAREADVSERYLGLLESGDGNVSVLLLRRIARALGVTIEEILDADASDAVEKRLLTRFLERLPPHRMEEVILKLMREHGREEALRRKRIALIGLRGAGKSTLGAALAAELAVPSIEVNREIERRSGLPVAEMIALYGQHGYRRLEREALDAVIQAHERAVIVVGGGAVTEEDTLRTLLAHCFTVWIKARPEEHMARVLAQGDLRPMAGNARAMDDLERILEARDALYRKADAIVDTAGETPQQSLRKLKRVVESGAANEVRDGFDGR